MTRNNVSNWVFLIFCDKIGTLLLGLPPQKFITPIHYERNIRLIAMVGHPTISYQTSTKHFQGYQKQEKSEKLSQPREA